MRKIILFSFLVFPFISLSQNVTKQKNIHWIPLEKAEEYSQKYNKNILIYFYKDNCEFCDKMKKGALSNKDIINTINNNFLPVKINGGVLSIFGVYMHYESIIESDEQEERRVGNF